MAATSTRSDATIHEDVLRELQWDTRVEDTEVGVEVDNGLVTLSGTVSSYAKKLAAQEAAHRVRGVLDVVNDITVRIPGTGGRTDADIAQAVRQALEWDALVPEENIETKVSNGWVTLEGQVDRWSQRQEAESAVRRLAGVLGVTNQITVSAPRVAPESVRQLIAAALERQVEREVERVQVAVHDGTVTLSGRVRSWAEKQAVLGAAGHAAGVLGVDDKLRIEPWA